MSQAVSGDDSSTLLEAETDEEAAASILTGGDPIRAFANLLTPIADEVKLHLDEDGLHVTAVDPANVALVDLTANAEGFDAYQIREPLTFGLNVSRFRSTLQWARKRGDDGDPVSIDIYRDPARMRVQIVREDQQTIRRQEWFGIDPDKIRQEPDLPDLDLPCRATPGVRALYEATKAYESDHGYLTREGGTLVLGTRDTPDPRLDADDEKGEVAETLLFPNTAWDERTEEAAEPLSSLFSMDYLRDITRGLKKSKADRVTVAWADEFPAKLHFQHEDWGFSGEFMLAPRIQSEDPA